MCTNPIDRLETAARAGTAARADLGRFEALVDENAVLARELAAAQQRSTRQSAEHASRIQALQREAMQLRAQVIRRDTAVAALVEDLQSLEAASPGLRSRVELSRECERLVERNHESQRLLLQARHEAERHRRRADELAAELIEAAPREGVESAGAVGGETPARLGDRAVLCVGGRPALLALLALIPAG